jgi:zinc protease
LKREGLPDIIRCDFERRFAMKRLLWIIGVLLFLSTLGKAQEVSKKEYRYAIVVKSKTLKDPKWKAVVDALVEKHAGKVFEYKSRPSQVKKRLKEFYPDYICFVAPPKEIIRSDGTNFVRRIHQFTRKLDKDPYTDAIWAILTGYNAEDALRIARHKEPLKVRYGLAATAGGWLRYLQDGLGYSEDARRPGLWWKKKQGEIDIERREDGPRDTTKSFVKELNSGRVDIMWTSGHASTRDWQIKYPGGGGKFVPGKKGKLYGVSARGKRYKIKSPNPKIYYAPGNCLIGKIDRMKCMVLSWIHSGGAYQYLGYTVPTGYGFMGWVVADNFFCLGDKFTFAEAFYVTNQQLLFGLKNRRILNPGDVRGYQGDRDVVALYGDPAWEARIEPAENTAPPRYRTQVRLIKGEGDRAQFEFSVRFNVDYKFNPNRRPWHVALFDFLPARVKDPEILDKGKAKKIVITDNFILVRYRGKVKKGFEDRIRFSAKIIRW